MKKIIVGLVLAVLLFAGVGHVQEFVYCRGLIQGQIDGMSVFFGPIAQGLDPSAFDEALQWCYDDPNGLDGMRPSFGLIYTGNVFDAAVDKAADVLEDIKGIFS